MRKNRKKKIDWWLGSTVTAASASNSDLWLDGTRTDYTSTVDNIGRILDSTTTRDSNAFVTVAESSGSLFKKPAYNGEGLYFNSLSAIRLGTVSSFNSLHNGTAWRMFIVFKYIAQAQGSTVRRILSTVGATTNNAAIGVYVANINSAGTPHTVRASIFNGGGGTPGIYEVVGTSNCLVDGEYHVLDIDFTGSALTINVWRSGSGTFTSVGTDSTGSGLSSSNAAATMCIGVEGLGGFKGYLKHIVAFYRTLSASDVTTMRSWCTTEAANVITPVTRPVVLWWGQSNGDPGSGTVNSTLSTDVPDLVGLQGGYSYNARNSAYTNKQNYWSQVTANVLTSDTTKHNLNLRLAKRFADAGKTGYFIGAGRGSTGLLDKVASVDWYANGGSATVGDMYPNWETIVTDGLEELVHVMRVTPDIRGLWQFQGENDCADAAATAGVYQAALENWIKSAIDFLNGLGHDTSNMNYFLMRTINSGVSATNVRTDQAYVMANFKTDFPAYDINTLNLIDTDAFDYSANHVTNVGASESGNAVADILVPLLP